MIGGNSPSEGKTSWTQVDDPQQIQKKRKSGGGGMGRLEDRDHLGMYQEQSEHLGDAPVVTYQALQGTLGATEEVRYPVDHCAPEQCTAIQ